MLNPFRNYLSSKHYWNIYIYIHQTSFRFQKYLETEDIIDENKKLFDIKFDKVENSLKLFELKARNAQEHVARFEEREMEMKSEYQKLHDRYTEVGVICLKLNK